MAAISAGYIGPADASVIPIETQAEWPTFDATTLATHRDNLKTLSFDVLNFSADELLVFVFEMISELGLFNSLSLDQATFRKFVVAARSGYQKNPYHNWFHAVDVMQTVYAFLHMSGQAGPDSRFSDVEKLAVLSAALCHDVDHPGVNNMFLIANKSELALLYNDQSVLENHHCARFFFLLQRPELNFCSKMSKEDFSQFRKVATNCVLATDMARHKEFYDKMIALVEDAEGSKDKAHNGVMLQVILKCADISNVVKPFEVAKKWAVRVTTEFYCQGDRERFYGMDPTPMCDPTKGTRCGSQIGFIDFVALNAYKAFVGLFPGCQPCLDNVQANKETWKTYTDDRLLSEVPVPMPDP